MIQAKGFFGNHRLNNSVMYNKLTGLHYLNTDRNTYSLINEIIKKC